ncbi:exosome complex exonuclease RRP44 protein A [Trifolium repens]|nr:exosome complex exonuclease RRP44 protein A [Trifolium repens]
MTGMIELFEWLHSENKRKASEEGISAETVESYVKSLDRPDLLDLLVRPSSEDVDMEEVEDHRPSKRKVIYSEHKPMSEITSGLHRGIYHQGKPLQSIRSIFELLPQDQWQGEKSLSIAGEEDEDEDEDVHLAPNKRRIQSPFWSYCWYHKEKLALKLVLLSIFSNQAISSVVIVLYRSMFRLRHSQGCCAFSVFACNISIPALLHCDSGGSRGCRAMLAI